MGKGRIKTATLNSHWVVNEDQQKGILKSAIKSKSNCKPLEDSHGLRRKKLCCFEASIEEGEEADDNTDDSTEN